MNAKIPLLDQYAIEVLVDHVTMERSTITYGELAEAVGRLRGEPMSARGFSDCLGRIQGYCKELGLPALSVMVTLKGEPTPGDGFADYYRKIHPEAKARTDEEIITEEMRGCLACEDWSPLLELSRTGEVASKILASRAYEEGSRVTRTLSEEIKRSRSPRAMALMRLIPSRISSPSAPTATPSSTQRNARTASPAPTPPTRFEPCWGFLRLRRTNAHTWPQPLLTKTDSGDNPVVKKTILILLTAALATTSAPVAWAESAVNDETGAKLPTQIQIARATATPGWSLIGTCEWQIDGSNCLVIRPAGNADEGSLPNASEFSSWPWSRRSLFGRVRVEGNVICGDTTRKMFADCKALQLVDLKGLDTSAVTDMSEMFQNCTKLESIDLNRLDTAKVMSMERMFGNCTSLASIELGNLDLQNATTMRGMFYGCSSLSSVNMNALNTSNVVDMGTMFYGCSSLVSVDLSSLNTSNTETMGSMFYGCTSLRSINLDGIDTSKVKDMGGMFYGCSSIASIDLLNLNTTSATNVSRMFQGCSSLKTLDLSDFDTRNTTSYSNVFLNSGLEMVILGDSFTLQNQLPNQPWYNAAGSVFEPNTIPSGIASAYAASPDQFKSLKVKLNESEKTVSADTTPFSLTATVAPSMKGALPGWRSSDPLVASVDLKGTITVHKAGTAIITALTVNSQSSCRLVVQPLIVSIDGNSSTEGQLTVEDAETAKALKGYSLLIRPSAHKGSADFEQRLLADVAQQQRKAGAIADLLDVCLVDTVTSIEMDPSVAENLPPLDLSISLDNDLKALTAKNILSLWAVSDSGDAAKAASLGGNHFQALATVPGTYAIIATAKADSTGGNGSSSSDSSGSTPGSGSSSGDGNDSAPGDGNESSGSNNDDGSSKPGNDDDNQNSGDPSDKPDSENKPSTDGSATDDNNNDSNDNSSNGSNSNNSNNTANQGSTAGAGSSSNSNMNSVSESKADEKAGNTNLSSTKDSKNSSGNNKLSQTSDYTALNIVLIFILSISAARAAVFSARKLRSLRRLR